MAMAGLMASVFVGSVAARADTTDELLDQLKAKGVLTKSEYSKLKQRHAAEVSKPGPHSAAPVGNGRYLTALDKGVGFRIPGQQIVTKDNGVVSVGDVDVKLTGALIFFGAEQFKNNVTGTAIAGGVTGGLAGGSTVNNSNAIRSGLLPSNVVLSLATNQMGWDLGFTVGAYFGGNNVNVGSDPRNANAGGSAFALGTPGIDLRQVFGTIGTPELGSLKIGRDLGLFGGQAILNDFTLFGVGTAAGNAAPGNTALGRIGLGYVYADWIPQITYTTPGWNGFTASVGMFSPLAATDIFTGGATSGVMTAHDQPQFQGQIKYVGQLAPDFKLTAWVDGITQLQRAETGDSVTAFISPGSQTRSSGVDGGARVDWNGFSVVGYGYWGSALGTTGLFWQALSPNGQARNSSGWYAEAEYTFGGPYFPSFLADRFTIGGSYGQSFLQANSFDWSTGAGYVPFLLHSNQSAIGFVRYKMTDWVAFQFEFINSTSINQSGGAYRTNAVVGGTTFFF
ncbi:hypothetical protein [Methylocella silvestris]|uniref:Porin n=1 Tax=Methylocella silvestris TaxID=199596 RepID=A0A2J7TG75_METSI|nr:hypothetical protein [Methylocella silvestris]PNG25743.1 hypothetical protein CR492_11525 [Methylocella silvestris]